MTTFLCRVFLALSLCGLGVAGRRSVDESSALTDQASADGDVDARAFAFVDRNHTSKRLPSTGSHLKMMVYDFDMTISKTHVFSSFRRKFGTRDPVAVEQLKSVSDDEWLQWFGGEARLNALQAHMREMTCRGQPCDEEADIAANRATKLYVASFGYVAELRFAMAWAKLDKYFVEIVGIDSCDEQMMYTHQQWGFYKWKLISKWAAAESPPLLPSEIGFADDTHDNLHETLDHCFPQSPPPTCHLFPINPYTALTIVDMKDIEAQNTVVRSPDGDESAQNCIDFDGKLVCPDDVCTD